MKHPKPLRRVSRIFPDRSLPLLCVAACLLSACKKPEVTVSQVPATPSSMAPVPSNEKMTHGVPASECRWTAPAVWEDMGATAMRVGNWRVQGAGGKTAEVTAMAFAGDVGGEFANINRWLSQVEAAPMTQEDFSKQRGQWDFSVGGRPAFLVFLPGKSQAILAASVAFPDKVWFFKMMGDRGLVESQRAAFEDFLRSVKWL